MTPEEEAAIIRARAAAVRNGAPPPRISEWDVIKRRAAQVAANQPLQPLEQIRQELAAEAGPPPLTVGDVLDLDPEEAPNPETAELIRKVRTSAPFGGGTPVEGTASPFSSEWGQQQAKNLRTVPLQRASGQFGISPSAMEQRLRELEFMRAAKRTNAGPIQKMEPETYAGLTADATDAARRDVASVMGESERRQNVVMPIDADKLVDDVMWYPAALRPFVATWRPGVAGMSVERGQTVTTATREHPLTWLLNSGLASRGLAAWALDPEGTWELGGEKGFGSERHVRRVMAGFDLFEELPASDVTNPVGAVAALAQGDIQGLLDFEKRQHAFGAAMALTMMEPDILSVATAGVAKAARASKLFQLAGGAESLANAFKRGAASIESAPGGIVDLAASARGVDQIAVNAAYTSVLAEASADVAKQIADLGRTSIGPSAGLVDNEAQVIATEAKRAAGALREVDPLTMRRLDTAQAAARADEAEAVQKYSDAYATLEAEPSAPAGVPEVTEAVREATAARRALADAQDELVSSTYVRDTTSHIPTGSRVADPVTGEQFEMVGYRAATTQREVQVARDLGEVMGAMREARQAKGAAESALSQAQAAAQAERQALAKKHAEELAVLLSRADAAKAAVKPAEQAASEAWRGAERVSNVAGELATNAERIADTPQRTLAKHYAKLAQAEEIGQASQALKETAEQEAERALAAQLAADVRKAEARVAAAEAEEAGKAGREALRAYTSPDVLAAREALKAAQAALVEASKTTRPGLQPFEGPILALVRDEAGQLRAVPRSSILRANVPGTAGEGLDRAAKLSERYVDQIRDARAAGDAEKVGKLQGARRNTSAVQPNDLAVMGHIATVERYSKEIAAARVAGNLGEVERLERSLKAARGKVVANIGDVQVASANAHYATAQKVLAEKLAALQDLVEKGRAPKSALAPFRRAVIEAEARAAVVRTLDDIPARVAAKMRQMAAQVETYAKAGVPEMGRGVINEVAKREGGDLVLNGGEYLSALTRRYGAEAIDLALEQPGMAPMRSLLRPKGNVLSSVRRLNVDGLQRLRQLEETIAGVAASSGDAAKGRALVTSLAHARPVSGWSRDAWLAWSYQMSTKVFRHLDAITASGVGLAAPAIREMARRAFERSYHGESMLNKAADEGGIEAVRKLLTTTGDDATSVATKALLYLRSILGEETFNLDQAVNALVRAPMAQSRVGDVSLSTQRRNLASLIAEPTTDGQALLDYLEGLAPRVQSRVAGAADSDLVTFRFVARAIMQAANQYDAVNDLIRVAGPHLSPDAVKALDFFARPESASLPVVSREALDEAERTMAAYGLPYAHTLRGALGRFFTSRGDANKIMRLGEIEGKGVYMPRHVFDALNNIPNKLAKELENYSNPQPFQDTFDRMARFWRLTAVNGWLLPRASIFFTNWLGDFTQMATTVGIVPAAKISAGTAAYHVPFVGRRLGAALERSSVGRTMLPAMFDANVSRLMQGSPSAVIETYEGPMSHARFMEEAIQAGVFGSINSMDLIEATRRTAKTMSAKVGEWIEAPPHIRQMARMLEEAQSRARLALYMQARTGSLGAGGPMAEAQARKLMVEALYDWKTGVPEHERAFIGRVFAFLTYRRGMMRQLGASLGEAFLTPESEYIGRALTGQTKLGRMKTVGRMVTEAPTLLDPQDPEEYLDDNEQLDRYGRTYAPWWVTTQAFLGGRQASPAEKLWHSEVAGRDVTYEALVAPAVTTMDQLWLIHTLAQTSLASTVHLAELAGLRPNLTAVSAAQLAERNIDALADGMMPGIDEAVRGLLKGAAGVDTYHGVAQPVPANVAVLLKRFGFEDFMAIHPDGKGQMRIDPGVMGFVTALMATAPPVTNIAAGWNIFDNAGYTESLGAGLMQGFGAWLGVIKTVGHDPWRSGDAGAEEKERLLKARRSALEKSTVARGGRK